MHTYHIITIGCQMNISDSERLASQLEKEGYKKTDNKYGADLVIINTCGVRQSAENRIYGLIPGIKKENPRVKIILTGCLSERKDVRRRLKDYVNEWLPIGGIMNNELPSCGKPSEDKRIMDKMPSKSVRLNSGYLKIKPKYESKFSAFVPIGNGCDNFCAYCVVPYARGREVYRPAEDILNEARGLVARGYKEIILIAQNVNSYKSGTPPLNLPLGKGENVPLLTKEGRKGRLDFADLLKMINDIKGDFWLRFLTSHPKDMSDKLIKAMAGCAKVCPQIYLPVQAGDNKVLKAMNRKYTVGHYKRLIKKIRQALPDISVTTDIIVGFPGETKKQFNNSLKLFKEVKFDMAYISEYSARPGTAAFKLADNVSRGEKRLRKNQLDKILRLTALANNKKYIGKTVRALVESKTKAGEWFAKTAAGKDVKIANQESGIKNQGRNLIGQFVNVKIMEVKEFCLAGVLMKL